MKRVRPSRFTKILIISIIALISTQAVSKKKKPDIDPKKVKKLLTNLDNTEYNSHAFDYWPQGGMRNSYYHLSSVIDYKYIVDVAPMDIFLSGPHSKNALNFEMKNSFGHYNPEFLKWALEEVTIILENQQLVEMTRSLYKQYLGDVTLTYWLCYKYMEEDSKSKKKLQREYESLMKAKTCPSGHYYNVVWNGENEYNFYRNVSEYECFNCNVMGPAVYFWLRRSIDGTEKEAFQILDTVVKTYFEDFANNYKKMKDM